MNDDQYVARLRQKFKKEILDPLGPMPHMNDNGYVETMFRDFVNEEEKKYFRYGEVAIQEPTSVKTSIGLYPEGYWSGQSEFSAGIIDGIEVPRLNPEHYKDEFEKRSELYESYDEDPEIKAKTDFFGAASDVTNDLSWGAGASRYGLLPFTMGPVDFYKYGEFYDRNMENLSGGLETMNRENAKRIDQGLPVDGIDDNLDRGAFNARMVEIEQGPGGVQGYLDRMEPEERETFIRLNNDILHSPLSEFGDWLFGDGNLSEFHEEFEKATGVPFDFGNQSHREALGRFTTNKNKIR